MMRVQRVGHGKNDNGGLASPVGSGEWASAKREGPYWVRGHKGYGRSRAFVTATARLGKDAPAEEREALGVELLASGEVDCECHIPPQGNRPLR